MDTKIRQADDYTLEMNEYSWSNAISFGNSCYGDLHMGCSSGSSCAFSTWWLDVLAAWYFAAWYSLTLLRLKKPTWTKINSNAYHWLLSYLKQSILATDWCQRYLRVVNPRVRRRRKFGVVSCTKCTVQGNDFELILTVKIETRNPVEGYFGSEFPAICTHCGVMAAWSRKTLRKIKEIFAFNKQPLTEKFSKFCSESFQREPIDLLCSNFVKFGRREVGEIVRCLPDKIFAWLTSCRYCADRTQNLPEPSPDNVLRVLQISSKSVHFRRSYSWRVNTTKTRRKVNPIFGWSLTSSRIKCLTREPILSVGLELLSLKNLVWVLNIFASQQTHHQQYFCSKSA